MAFARRASRLLFRKDSFATLVSARTPLARALIFRRWCDSRMFTDDSRGTTTPGAFSVGLSEQIGSFRKKGYVLVSRTLPEDHDRIAKLREEILDEFETKRNSLRYLLWRKFNSVATPENRHSMPLRLTPLVMDALKGCIGPVSPFLDAQLSPKAELVELSALISLPGSCDQVVHCDTEFFEGGDTIVSGFLALAPVTLEQGPTCLFPGTHTKGFHDSIPSATCANNHYGPDGTLESPVLEQEPWADRIGTVITFPAEHALLNAGDLLLFDTRVFHYGSGNASGIPRPLVYFSFQLPFTEGEAIRKVDGFTYHCHESVIGKYQLGDFNKRCELV